MRAIPALVLLLALAGAAHAQTLVSPVKGAFTDVYVVSGRVIDARGEPVVGASLTITLDQPGVRAAPLSAMTNCKGDFITSFTLRMPTREGVVRVEVEPRGESGAARNETPLDPFYRRSDLTLRLPGPWSERCPGQENVWAVAVTVAGRVVNRTQPYPSEGVTFEAEPYNGTARLRYTDVEGNTHCPPAANAPTPDVCDLMFFDERGDYRYTFTYSAPIAAGGTMSILLGERTYTFPVDPATRMATFRIEATGQGAPAPPHETPASAALLAPLAALAAALLLRRAR